METRARIAAVGRLAAYACALVVAASTAVFAWRGTLFVATADAWSVIATFLARYYAGTLTLADFFAKRDALDHSQPVQKLLFLANARWFDFDLSYEAAAGIAFGVAFIAVIVAIVRADAKGLPRSNAVVALATLGVTAVTLSLNDDGIFTWSLATLSLFYPLGVALMLVFANHCIARNRPWLLGAGMLVACLLLDTSAILAAGAIAVLIAYRWRRFDTTRTPLQLVAAIAVGVALYVAGYALALPDVHSSVATSGRLVAYLAHASEIWKAFVVPLGAVVASPHRIKVLHGVAAFWTWLVPAAILVAAGHVWFWREILRRDDTRLTFVAAGLMLYFYATLAGILWARVPRYGFDYFMQSRYLVFYSMQLVAMLMVAASNAARSERSGDPFAAFAAGVLVCAAAALVYARTPTLQLNIDFNRMLDQKAIELAEDPARVPPDCPANHLTLCKWVPAVRVETLDLMRREQLNIFSPRFRERHALPPLPPSLQTPPAAR